MDLLQSCFTNAQKIEFIDLLEKYKDAFCLQDERGLAPHMEVHLDLIDKTPLTSRLCQRSTVMENKDRPGLHCLKSYVSNNFGDDTTSTSKDHI